MPDNRDISSFFDENEEASPTNLPMAPVSSDEDDDGIFINWPGFDYGDNPDRPLYDDEDTAPDEDGADARDDDPFYDAEPLKKKKKRDKQKKKEKKSQKQQASADAEHTDDGEDYAFRHAADSDMEESRGKRKKPKKDESDNETTLSSIKYYKHTARLREIFLRRLLPIVLVLVFIVGFVLYFFRLQHLVFDNLRGYDAEEVFRAIHVRKNQFIFTINDGDIERRLRAKFPYIEDVEVELTLPDTAHLVFTEDSARFYTKIYDEYFVISQSMRVLARYSSTDELDPGLREITLPAVSYAVVGHSLRFFDMSYLSFLSSFLDTIENADIYRGIASMDLSNRFDIILNYEDRLLVELGDDENLETRLLFVHSTIDALEADQRGTLHIIDNKQAIFSPEARDAG
ncbi:MAG: FtsQ-type POTRA domain-containing protein [Ruminococcaceae bacterium]|nr:FtsQ-type POTRA domain-containing protein [Oscillospiraceae bacterium]